MWPTLEAVSKRVFDLVMRNRTFQSLFRTRSSTTCLCPGCPGHRPYETTLQTRCRCAASSRDDWTPCSDAYFASPLARGSPGKQCGLTVAGDFRLSCSLSMAGSEKMVRSRRQGYLLRAQEVPARPPQAGRSQGGWRVGARKRGKMNCWCHENILK